MRLPNVVLAATLVLLCASLLRLYHEPKGPNGCEMTYMYSSYVSVSKSETKLGGRYELFLYREDANPKQELPPSGWPALFIPGNAGSYKQVRSLASETARRAARVAAAAAATAGGNGAPPGGQPGWDLDWYVLDTREELSAFDGVLLERQADFALQCLRFLKARYSNSSGGAPRGIFLVGHSMGGVVARAALSRAVADPELGPSAVAVLLTLASPHQYPPLLLQPAQARFYSQLASKLLPAVPVISVDGGRSDTQIASPLTRLDGLVHPSCAFQVTTLNIPGVWAPAGHNDIVWCNQLMQQLASMLLNITKEGPAHSATPPAVAAATAAPPATQQQQRLGVGGGETVAGNGGPATTAQKLGATTFPELPAARGVVPTASQLAAARGPSGVDPTLTSQAAQGFIYTTIRNHLSSVVLPALGYSRGAAAVTNLTFTDADADLVTDADGDGSSAAAEGREGGSGSSSRRQLVPHAAVAAGRHCEGRGLRWYRERLPSKAVKDKTVVLAAADLKAAGSEGSLLTWHLPDFIGNGSASSFSLMVSAAQPCSEFRAWLHRGVGNAAAGHRAVRVVEVTGLTAPVPAVQDAAMLPKLLDSQWMEVLNGRNFLAPSAWLLRLPPERLAHVTNITVWIGGGGGGGGGSSNGQAAAATAGPRAGFLLAAQLGDARMARLQLDIRSLVVSATRHVDGPMLVELRLRHLLLLHSLGLKWRIGSGRPKIPAPQRLSSMKRVTPEPHIATTELRAAFDASYCWHPVAVIADAANNEHITVNQTVINLGPAARRHKLVIVLDPRCSYSLSVTTDFLAFVPVLLLTHASSAAGILVAIVLMILSHQMSLLSKMTHTRAGGAAVKSYSHSYSHAGANGYAYGFGAKRNGYSPWFSYSLVKLWWWAQVTSPGTAASEPVPFSVLRSMTAVVTNAKVAACAGLVVIFCCAGTTADPLLLRVLGLRRLGPSPPLVGAAVLAAVGMTLLLLDIHLSTLFKSLTEALVGVVVRYSRLVRRMTKTIQRTSSWPAAIDELYYTSSSTCCYCLCSPDAAAARSTRPLSHGGPRVQLWGSSARTVLAAMLCGVNPALGIMAAVAAVFFAWKLPKSRGLIVLKINGAADDVPASASKVRMPCSKHAGSHGGSYGGYVDSKSVNRQAATVKMMQHMHQAWLLYYGSGFLMLAPSLAAWLRLPPGQHHMSNFWDAAACLPVVAHCFALTEGHITAFIGTPVRFGRRGMTMHGLLLRGGAAYMLLAALVGQSVRAFHVQAVVATVMLCGHWAGYAWRAMHLYLYYSFFEPDAKTKSKHS